LEEARPDPSGGYSKKKKVIEVSRLRARRAGNRWKGKRGFDGRGDTGCSEERAEGDETFKGKGPVCCVGGEPPGVRSCRWLLQKDPTVCRGAQKYNKKRKLNSCQY